MKRTILTRKEARDLIASRVELGAAAEFALARAETELQYAKAELASVQLRRKQIVNTLSGLTGDVVVGFERTLDTAANTVAPRFPVGLPASVISSRPDVAAAERDLRATAERVGIAKAAFYPSVRLTGSSGWESGDLASFLESGNRVWSWGPQLYLPLFQGGKNKARLRRALAGVDEARALFQGVVLTALNQVQLSLDTLRLLNDQSLATSKAADAARNAAALSQARYDEGFVSYLEVVDSERAALAAERTEVALRGARLVATIDLIQALGGGWEDTSP